MRNDFIRFTCSVCPSSILKFFSGQFITLLGVFLCILDLYSQCCVSLHCHKERCTNLMGGKGKSLKLFLLKSKTGYNFMSCKYTSVDYSFHEDEIRGIQFKTAVCQYSNFLYNWQSRKFSEINGIRGVEPAARKLNKNLCSGHLRVQYVSIRRHYNMDRD